MEFVLATPNAHSAALDQEKPLETLPGMRVLFVHIYSWFKFTHLTIESILNLDQTSGNSNTTVTCANEVLLICRA